MLAKRIIPCLDVKDGRVVKGRNFAGLQDVSDPVALARFYNSAGADELVFYDITASHEGRKLFADTLTAVASQVFIPLTVGGGINDLSDFDRVLKCGADKVSVNSGAIADPSLVGRAAKKYGDQCVVLSIDAKRADGRYEVYAKGGRVPTGIDAVEWARRGQEEGAGEIVLNSIDLTKSSAFRHRIGRRGESGGLRQAVPRSAGRGRGTCRQHLPLRRNGHPRPQMYARGGGGTGKTVSAESDAKRCL